MIMVAASEIRNGRHMIGLDEHRNASFYVHMVYYFIYSGTHFYSFLLEWNTMQNKWYICIIMKILVKFDVL